MASDTESNDVAGIDKPRDPRSGVPGVLLGDMIQKYIDELSPRLIENAEKSSLRPASYNLRLGDRYYQDGCYKKLTPDRPALTIKPHGMVVISTHEKLNLPKYLIARWNLRVSLVYKGLLWAGGPQVDPGFQGNLFCPLYNLSTREVSINRLDPIFTIDFETTTEYNKEAASKNPNLDFPPSKRNRNLEDFLPSYVLKSSVAELRDRVEKSEKATASKVNDLQSTVLIGLSIVFAGLTIVATLPSIAGSRLTFPPVDWVTGFYLALSTGSLILSLFAINRTRRIENPHDKENQDWT